MTSKQTALLFLLIITICIPTNALAQEKPEPEVNLPPKAKHGLSVAKARRIGTKQLAEDPKVREILAELDGIIEEVNGIYESYINIAREDRNSSERAAKIQERDNKLKILHARREALVKKYEDYKNSNPAYQALQKRAKDEVTAKKDATKKNVHGAKQEALEDAKN